MNSPCPTRLHRRPNHHPKADKMRLRLLLTATALLATGTARANDSEAAILLGGLTLSPSAWVTLDSEDLYLSEKRIRVRYRFVNTASRDENLLIAFPLPAPTEQQLEEARESEMYQEWDQLDFKTLVDGKPAPLDRHDVPLVRGKSVEARLKKLGWPVLHWKDAGLAKRLNALTDAQAAPLVAEGLLVDDAGSGGGAVRNLRPGWTVQTNITRVQNFPAGSTVTVEHSYRPYVGGSAVTSLNRDIRAEAMSGPEGLAASFCVDKAFLTAYDKRVYGSKAKPNPDITVVQSWFGYILKSGANWKGPIRNFRMIVDKGKPGNLVSFCMNGVKKISPTQFEIVKTDFEPKQDMDILLVDFLINGEGR
jgi:hypothetical protein